MCTSLTLSPTKTCKLIFLMVYYMVTAYNTTIQDKIPNHMSNLITNKLVVKWVFTQ